VTTVAPRTSRLSPSSRPEISTPVSTTSSARPRVRDDWGREVNLLTKFFTNLDALRTREEGQTMAEYGVVLAVITIGVVLALGTLSGAISAALERVVGFL
jgi:Flp pilus assembly pilin Flp